MNALARLDDADLPLSPIFIDFVARWLDKSGFVDERWADQLSEALVNPNPAMRRKVGARLERLVLDESAQAAIANVYGWFSSLATARSAALEDLHSRYQFISIVGLARTGGSYLTAELFSALGNEPSAVPSVIAHDGFPDAQPISLLQNNNQWISCLMSMSEYLTMIEMYFPTVGLTERVVVPKKLTKSVYAGSFFNAVMGNKAEYIITIRHPIASCISTYDKSGGFPSDGKYRSRSNIESWIKRDLMLTGVSASDIESMDYFDAYSRYWEQYYIHLAMSGVTANRSRIIVPFGRRSMEETATGWHERFRSGREPSRFVSVDGLDRRHPEWIVRSEEALKRVAAVWSLVGLKFPAAELSFCI